MIFGTSSVPFRSDRDIPSLEGKVILVTGGNAGLGKQCVLEYAQRNPSELWLVARTLDKAKAAAEDVQKQLTAPANIKTLAMDLASFDSIKAAAAAFVESANRLDILMLNAGIMAQPPGLTKDGYELQFGTNYLGHTLLTNLLLPVLKKTANDLDADTRIITLSSHGHTLAPTPSGIEFESLKTDASALSAYARYGQSKLAAILWARQMAKEYPQFTVASIHPGVVNTNLMNNATATPMILRVLTSVFGWFLKSPAQGAMNQLWASVGKGVKSGLYYEPVGVEGGETALALSDTLAKQLWDWTQQELQRHVAT